MYTKYYSQISLNWKKRKEWKMNKFIIVTEWIQPENEIIVHEVECLVWLQPRHSTVTAIAAKMSWLVDFHGLII